MARERATAEETYPLRVAARLTGLSPELLRAWERRHGVVEPSRTPGGTRRYSAADLERLRLVKAAVDAGHRIGKVARLDAEELKRRAASGASPPADRLSAILAAIDRLDAVEARRLLGFQLSALGPIPFAREIALPLVHEIGDRWARDELGISSEHLASGVLRSLLGSSLVPTATAHWGPRIVFATPTGERHELGLQMAALTALGAGANPVYLGAELPVEDVLEAVVRVDAAALALGIVTLAPAPAARALGAIRGGLPEDVRLFIGGAGAAELPALAGVTCVETLDEFERHVALLGLGDASDG